ncbi:MAG: peptidogalycan biosysnthesis protein [Jatrophihabitantaceae bacterium]
MAAVIALSGRVVPHSELPSQHVLGNSWWSDRPWLSFMARANDDDFRYLLIETAEGRLCAVAPLMLSGADHGPFFLNSAAIIGDERAFGDSARLTSEQQASYQQLLTGLDNLRAGQYPSVALSSRGTDHGVSMIADAPVSRELVLQRLPAILAEVAAGLGCRSYAILHLGESDRAIIEPAATAGGYCQVLLGAESCLSIPDVTSRAEYQASLRSRRRSRFAKEMQDYLAHGLRTVTHYGPDAITEDVVRLQARLRAKHGMSTELAATRKEFSDIQQVAGEHCLVLTAEREGRTIGFVLALHDRARQALHVRSSGFDDDDPVASSYFVLVYQDVPGWAAEHGIRTVWYGISASEAKRARGCTLLPLYGYLGFTGAAAGRLGQIGRLQSLGEQRRLAELGCSFAEPSLPAD